MITAEKFLRDLFESDREAEDYFDKHPMYEHDYLVGAPPWWPPLSEVWRHQGEMPFDLSADQEKCWQEAWELLQRLHAEYRAARPKRRRR